jgi:hypothetical protein
METAMDEVKVAMPVAEVTEEAAPDLEATVAPEVVVEVYVDALPEVSTEVVVRSHEIQDVAPIRSTPMAEVTSTSHDGLELVADDLVDLATMARNLESMRCAEQWMKVRCRTLSS